MTLKNQKSNHDSEESKGQSSHTISIHIYIMGGEFVSTNT